MSRIEEGENGEKGEKTFLSKWKWTIINLLSFAFCIINIGRIFVKLPSEVDHQECCKGCNITLDDLNDNPYHLFQVYRWWMLVVSVIAFMTPFHRLDDKYVDSSLVPPFMMLLHLTWFIAIIISSCVLDQLINYTCINPSTSPFIIIKTHMGYELFLLILVFFPPGFFILSIVLYMFYSLGWLWVNPVPKPPNFPLRT